MKKEKIFIPLLVIFCLNLVLLWGIEGYYFWRQLGFWIAGGLILVFILRLKFSLSNLDNFSLGWYLISLGLLILPLIFSQFIRGSSRWLFIWDQSFQPSELAKPLFILGMAGFLSKWEMGKIGFYLKSLLLFALPIVLLLLEPNLGTALVFVFASGVMLLFSKGQKKHFLITLVLLIPFLFIFNRFFLANYQQERILSFLNPQADPLGGGYNLAQAMVAFGSGKFMGRGLGLGGQTRLYFLPERHTDFIFASLGESFGFFGAFLLLFSYFYLFIALLKKVTLGKESFISLFKVGLISYLWFQVVVNIGINLGLLPVTGLPLPFFSYGGSSLLSSFLSFSLIVKD